MSETSEHLKNSPFVTGERRYPEGNNATIEEIYRLNEHGQPTEIREGWLLKTYNRERKSNGETLKHPKAEEVKEHIQTLKKI